MKQTNCQRKAIFISYNYKVINLEKFTDSDCYQSFEIILLSIFKIRLENDLYEGQFMPLKIIKERQIWLDKLIALKF